jgi:hypothetical protein
MSPLQWYDRRGPVPARWSRNAPDRTVPVAPGPGPNLRPAGTRCASFVVCPGPGSTVALSSAERAPRWVDAEVVLGLRPGWTWPGGCACRAQWPTCQLSQPVTRGGCTGHSGVAVARVVQRGHRKSAGRRGRGDAARPRGSVEVRSRTADADRDRRTPATDLPAGPCRECIEQRATLAVETLTTATRWPTLTAGAQRSGLVSMTPLRCPARGRPWGALDLYRSSTLPWSDQVELPNLVGTRRQRANPARRVTASLRCPRWEDATSAIRPLRCRMRNTIA